MTIPNIDQPIGIIKTDNGDEFQAAQIYNELKDASEFASATMQSLIDDGTIDKQSVKSIPETAAVNENTEQEKTEKIEHLKKKFKKNNEFDAKRKRELGRKELERTYSGALIVKSDLKIYDLNIASSAERYLGLIDKALYTTNRYGTSVFGSVKTEKLVNQLTVLIEKYCSEGSTHSASAQLLLDTEKNAVFEGWITPEYQGAVFDLQVNAKNRLTVKMIAHIILWDNAIRDLGILDWNGKVDSSQTAQVRAEERRFIQALANFSNSAIQGLFKTVNESKAKRAEKASS